MSPVLLIDDDVELVELFADYLQREGFPVGRAHDGEAGARALVGTVRDRRARPHAARHERPGRPARDPHPQRGA